MKNILVSTALLALAAICSAGESGYRIARVNTAMEQRNDPTWKRAHAEILETRFSPRAGDGLIEHGNSHHKEIALTFDDGPHGADTVKLLQILKRENVPATFFVVGMMALQHPENLREEVADGHEVANHTFSHVTLTKVPYQDVETEYEACSEVIQSITGKRPEFCRPPGGDWNGKVVQAASSLGMSTVLWTDDPGDYYDPGDSVIEQRTLDTASNGGIILLHDGAAQTLQVLPKLIETLRAKGYKFVTMSQLAKDRPSAPLARSA